MEDNVLIGLRVTRKQRDVLRLLAYKKGFKMLSSYIKSEVLPESEDVGLLVVDDFRDVRFERKSFSCSNELWREVEKATGGRVSLSKFVRDALEEKLGRGSS